MSMDIGKTYQQTWTVLGCSRTARFYPEAVCKSGAVRGVYVDADGKRFKRFFVKAEQFGTWTAETEK